MNEQQPTITINGIVLSPSQASLIKIAIEAMSSDLIDIGLGEDETGRDMTKMYLARIDELRVMYLPEQKDTKWAL